jgi:hypothetical protein
MELETQTSFPSTKHKTIDLYKNEIQTQTDQDECMSLPDPRSIFTQDAGTDTDQFNSVTPIIGNQVPYGQDVGPVMKFQQPRELNNTANFENRNNTNGNFEICTTTFNKDENGDHGYNQVKTVMTQPSIAGKTIELNFNSAPKM